MNNIFIKAIEYLEQNPADKDIKLALTIEIPANTKPSETGTQLQMTGPVTALIAFAVQAMVDASAEFVGRVRSLLDGNNVIWQTGELGKVDAGGGGTIAYILALYGMNVIDSGVPVLNMHAPWEATSKADIYEAYRGYKAFAENASM